MDDKRIKEIKKNVENLLCSNRLKQAIETLGEDIENLQDWELRSRYNELLTAYSYMLDYLRMGMQDPERERLYDELVGKCYTLNDLIAATRENEHSIKVYSQKCRKYKNLENFENLLADYKKNIANTELAKSLPAEESKRIALQLQQEHERLLIHVWESIWTSRAWNKSIESRMLELVNDRECNANDRAAFVSAITMSALKCFEPLKAISLCKLATSSEVQISMRAITGVVIVLLRYDERIRYYKDIVAILEMLKEDHVFRNRIETIQIQLLRCRETQKIDRRMREEIIPAMMNNPRLNGSKSGIEILSEIEQDEDKNPEWGEWIEKDEIKEKIEEMSKWQMEGADVYMSTFSQLKNFPFFGDIANWFRPFDTEVPSVAEILPDRSGIEKTLLGNICSSPIFCNSDKYSFCFTFKQIPQEQREMLLGQIPDEAEMDAETNRDNKMKIERLHAETISNQYIQDLYRFFKVSNFRHEFSDPFTSSLNILESKSLSGLADSEEMTLRVFRYLVEKGYYNEAYGAGTIYEKKGKGDAQFYQEMGFCMQKERRLDAAIDYYTKADIIKPDTLWTLRHTAQCYRMQGELEKALSYYQIAEELAPENISLLLQTGESFAAIKRYEEAFSRFYKAEYLKPGSLRALRAIAWCSFVTGNDMQAREYYNRITGMPKASYQDYMNAAHVEWVSRNNVLATELYKKAKGMCSNAEEFAEHIMHDKEILISRGISEKEILMLRDLVDGE